MNPVFLFVLVVALLVDVYGWWRRDTEIVAIAGGVTIVDLIARALGWL